MIQLDSFEFSCKRVDFMKKIKSLSQALLIVGGMLALSGTSQATAITGGTTSVALNSATVNSLVGLGFGIAAIAPGTLTNLEAVFPITGGDTSSQILHSGGLAFKDGNTTLDLTNFTINLMNDKLYATVNNNSSNPQIAFLDLGAGGALSLDPAAAAALVSIFGIPNLSGAPIGVATVNATLAPEPSTVGLVALAGLAVMLVARKRAVQNI
jgi:hypothetical protein